MTIEPLKELENLRKENEDLKARLERYEPKQEPKTCLLCGKQFTQNKGVHCCDSCLESVEY